MSHNHNPTMPLGLNSIKDAFAETASLYGLRENDVERIFYDTIESFFRTKDYWLDGDGLKIQSHTKVHRGVSPQIFQDIQKNGKEAPSKLIAFLRKIHFSCDQERVYHEYLIGGLDHARRYAKENGISMDGKAQEHIGYKNLTKKEFHQFYKLYMSSIKQEKSEAIKRHIDQILESNGKILYCEMIKYAPGDNVYHLRPLLNKNTYLETLIVIVRPEKNRDGDQVSFPEHLCRIPIYIQSIKRNKNALSEKHAIKGVGEIMNFELADFHFHILNQKFQKKHDVDLELKAVKVNAKGTRIQYDSAYKLPVDVIKVIGGYFRSFNAHAYIIND